MTKWLRMANKSILKRFYSFYMYMYIFLKTDSLNCIYGREIFYYLKNFKLLDHKFSKITFWNDNNFYKNKIWYENNNVL